MPAEKTICRTCNAEILAATGDRTGGFCMPCSEGSRYGYVAYLTIEDFFAKAGTDDCLAANMEPHPTNREFAAVLRHIRSEDGVTNCLIPVDEYQDPENEQEPYSDRVFVMGPVEESVVADWAKKLNAEIYREERPGAEVPLTHSKGEPVWCLVWD